MKRRMLYLALALSWLAYFAVGCGDDGVSSGQIDTLSQMGTLSVSLTDAPAAFSEVNITFSEISAHIDGQWVTVENDPQTIDLLEWNNGRTIEIGRAQMPAGRYTQIRLIITDAEVVVDNTHHQMTVPSGARTGLKLGPAFTIEPNLTFELVVDFDASRSVVTTGPRQAPTGYMLQPRLRMVPRAASGAISGTVTNPFNRPVAFAIVGSDTLTSSAVNTSGAFTLPFLPEGSYQVSVADSMNAAVTRGGILVEVGMVTQIGDVTLQ